MKKKCFENEKCLVIGMVGLPARGKVLIKIFHFN